jgi:hypothetical protein
VNDHSKGKWCCLTSADPKAPHIIDCFYGTGSEFAAKEICKVTPMGEEGLANMQLIKSAPEMFALLTDIKNWLVCSCIATPEDMAQSFQHYQEQIAALLRPGERP